MNLTNQFLRNILSSWGNYVVRIGVTFLFVPYVAGIFGDTRYGVWVILFQAIGYFSLLDMGLSSAITRYVAGYLHRSEYGRINQVLASCTILYTAAAALVLLGTWVFAQYGLDLFAITDPVLLGEGRTALLILGLFMAMNFVLMPYGNSLTAFQRHDLTRLLIVGEELMRVSLWVWLLSRGYGLVAMALAMIATSLARHLAGLVLLKRLHPWIGWSSGAFARESIGRLVGYSKITLGITICWLVIFNTDTVLLGMLYSAAAAAYFYPAAQLMLYLRNVVNAIGIPLTPLVSHFESAGELDKIRTVYLKGLVYVSYLSAVMAAGVIVLAPQFVSLWLPAEFSGTAQVMGILALGTAVFLPHILGNAVLFGTARHKYLLYVLIMEAAAKLGLSLWLVPRHGVVGMAWAAVIPQIVIYTTIYPSTLSVLLRLSFWRTMWLGLRSLLVGGGTVYAAGYLLTRQAELTSWSSFFIATGILIALAAIPGWFLTAPADRARIAAFFRFADNESQ